MDDWGDVVMFFYCDVIMIMYYDILIICVGLYCDIEMFIFS